MPARTRIRGPLRALVRELGGVTSAAKILRVHRYTLWRWGTRRTEPTNEERERVNRIARKRGLTTPFPEERST